MPAIGLSSYIIIASYLEPAAAFKGIAAFGASFHHAAAAALLPAN